MNEIKNLKYNDLQSLLKNTKDQTINNTNYVFLGKGGEGIVYKIGSSNVAMKIYKIKSKRNKEICVLKKLNNLMNENVCNNFLKIYGSKNLFGHAILLMDLIDGNLEKWVEVEHSKNEWLIMIFQILYGLLILQTKLKMCHSDMKPKNILFKKVNSQINKYTINDNEICVLKTDILFMISDFGHSQSLFFNDNKMKNSEIELCIENNLDLKHVIAFHKRLAVTIITNHYTLENILDMGKNDINFIEYVKWITNEIDKDLKNYNPSIKKHMLFRDLSYYMLEKGYMDINDLPMQDKNIKIILPPKEIIELLESLEEVKGINSLFNKLIEIGKMVNKNYTNINNNFNLNY